MLDEARSNHAEVYHQSMKSLTAVLNLVSMSQSYPFVLKWFIFLKLCSLCLTFFLTINDITPTSDSVVYDSVVLYHCADVVCCIPNSTLCMTDCDSLYFTHKDYLCLHFVDFMLMKRPSKSLDYSTTAQVIVLKLWHDIVPVTNFLL